MSYEISIPPKDIEEIYLTLRCQSRWLDFIYGLAIKLGFTSKTDDYVRVGWITPRDISGVSIGYEIRVD